MPDTHPHDLRDLEITLNEIWGVIVQHKYLVISFPFIAIVIALIVTSALKPQWEATALIRIGQVGSQQQLIEPTARALARLKLEGFKLNVLKRMGMSENWDDIESRLYLEKTKVEAGGAPDLIKITSRGHSPEQAQQFVEASLAELTALHTALSEPTINRLLEQVRRLNEEINFELSFQNSNKRTLSKNMSREDRFMANVVLANDIYQRSDVLRGIKQQLLSTEEQLDPFRTYPTSLLQSVYVNDKPVMPAIKWIIPLAGIFGLFAGLFIAFLRHNLRTPNCESNAASILR